MRLLLGVELREREDASWYKLQHRQLGHLGLLTQKMQVLDMVGI